MKHLLMYGETHFMSVCVSTSFTLHHEAFDPRPDAFFPLAILFIDNNT